MAAKKRPATKSEATPPPAKEPAVRKPAATQKPAAKKVPEPKAPARKAPVRKEPETEAPPMSNRAAAAERRFRQIEEAAYYIAEASGWTKDATTCWLEGEAQVDAKGGA
jgi:hypothetical protein